MLVLRRKRSQKIMIGDNITITVVETSQQFTRLGIDAPREIAVHREEVAQRIEESRVQSPESRVRSKDADHDD